MGEAQIRDGTGRGRFAKVTNGNRLLTQTITEPISAERSRKGKLYGIGTGNLSLGGSFDGPVLWFRNDSDTELMFVQKIIFGWNGGTSSRNTTVFSLINYQTTEPTGANTSIDFQIENINKSGSSAAVTFADATGHKWDGSGSAGMTGTSGGFAQIPNRLAIGNHSIPIDGEIILGKSDSMRFDVTPDEAGLFNVAVVVYLAPEGGIAEE